MKGYLTILLFSRLFKDSDPPVCILLVSSKDDGTRLAIDPPIGRTYGSFFEVFSVLMRLNGLVIPGTERPTDPPTRAALRMKETYEDAKVKLEALQAKLTQPLFGISRADSSSDQLHIEDTRNTGEVVENPKPLNIKRRRGGRKGKELARRREIVEGWLKVQADELQITYCERVGISPRTLREWMKELNS